MLSLVRADTLILIAENPAAHGAFDGFSSVQKTVYCTVRSATYTDILTAKAEGLQPEVVFRLSHSFDYDGEKICTWNGQQWNIDRTYVSEADWIELTCSRRYGDANV